MKEERQARKAQRAYYSREAELKQCPVCKRWHTKRRSETCSDSCAQKAAATPLGDSAVKSKREAVG